MPTLHLDHTSNLSCEEDRGVIRSLNRRALVEFTKAELDADGGAIRNQGVLAAALDHLDSQGLVYLSRLANNPQDATSRFNSLVMVKRSPALLDKDPAWVEVMLTYNHILDGHNQEVIAPGTGLIYGKGKCSIVEKTTNFFRANGDPSKEKALIVVSHTYPVSDTRIGGLPFDSRFPRTIFQIGEIKVPFTQINYNAQGIVYTDNPVAVAVSIVAKVNSVAWQGQKPKTWICTEAAWESNDQASDPVNSRPIYKFHFEFQHNSDGWQPTVVFNDKETGLPPIGVIRATIEDENGVVRYRPWNKPIPPLPGDQLAEIGPDNAIAGGIWEVPALAAKDYNQFFRGLFEGRN